MSLGTKGTVLFAYRHKFSDSPTLVASESPGRPVKARIAGPHLQSSRINRSKNWVLRICKFLGPKNLHFYHVLGYC